MILLCAGNVHIYPCRYVKLPRKITPNSHNKIKPYFWSTVQCRRALQLYTLTSILLPSSLIFISIIIFINLLFFRIPRESADLVRS